MAKLISSRPENRFHSRTERWELDNHLKVSICFEKKHILTVSSTSGDVADQVFERLNKSVVFEGMTLTSGSNWFINIDPALLKDFMEQVEAIDTKTLRKGNVY